MKKKIEIKADLKSELSRIIKYINKLEIEIEENSSHLNWTVHIAYISFSPNGIFNSRFS